MYDIPFDRSFLQLSKGIRHVMPSTDRKLELTAKASMAQPVSQPAVCCSGLNEMCAGLPHIQKPVFLVAIMSTSRTYLLTYLLHGAMSFLRS